VNASRWCSPKLAFGSQDATFKPVSLEDERDCQQFLDDLEDITTLKRQPGVGNDVAERIQKLVNLARGK